MGVRGGEGRKDRWKVGFELASHLEGRFRVTTLREERAMVVNDSLNPVRNNGSYGCSV